LFRTFRARSDVPVIIVTGDRRDEIDRVIGLCAGACVIKPFDRRSRHLTNPDGALVALTKGEYALLAVFLDEPQRPLTHLL
jgi:DNA-binding response OmpR family regulator